MTGPAMREYTLRVALSELESFRREYQNLEALAGVFAELDRVAATMKKRKDRKGKGRRAA